MSFFNVPPATHSTSSTTPLFGGSSAFPIPKPTSDNSTSANAGSNPPFFKLNSSGSNGSGGEDTTANTSSHGSGLFNLPSKPAVPPSSSTAIPNLSTASNIFATFNKAPSTSATHVGGESKDATSSSTTSSSLFGNLSTNKDAKKDGNLTASSIFGPKVDEKKDESTSSKEVDKKDATGTGTAPNAASTAVVAIPPPSMLKGKSLEEILNRWITELDVHAQEFDRYAAEVAVWDRALIENGNNIAALYGHVLSAERQQNDINESLEHIEQQQRDLTTTLDAYEKSSTDIFGNPGGGLRTLDSGPADNERDKNYLLATDLHTHLDDLSASLAQMIDSVNALTITSKSSDATDPMSQISQILSTHLESLQWIDGSVRDLEGKASEIEKRIKESGNSYSGNKSKGFGLNE